MSTERDDLLMTLARGDGQAWTRIADASRHTAEVMYGKQADAILASNWLAARDRRVAADALREAALEGAGEAYTAGLRFDAVAVTWLNERSAQIKRGDLP